MQTPKKAYPSTVCHSIGFDSVRAHVVPIVYCADCSLHASTKTFQALVLCLDNETRVINFRAEVL